MNALQDMFRPDALAGFCAAFVCLYAVLTAVYSWAYFRDQPRRARFYGYLVLTTACSIGALMADHLVLLIAFWGLLAVLLYLLIALAPGERAAATAQKALLLVGGADALMVLGAAIVWNLIGRPDWPDLRISAIEVNTESGAGAFAYLLLMAAAVAKAGGMPLHTWVPDMAEDAHVPATAFLPASLDKLLGIYFATRLSIEMFVLTPWLHTLVMGVGSATILAAVMMALVQHDLKRLLGYHAVSQVGYMLLGIGAGTALGLAGALFHMLNNTVYKTALFFAGGSVEHRMGTSNLDELGGLSRAMPFTFAAFGVASLAIAGVPPFNGFYSKWMIYQAIFEVGRDGGYLWIVWLAAAMFGSALTLASFLKLLHAVFLGQPARRQSRSEIREVSPAMWAPPALLAGLCVLFGLLPNAAPLRYFIYPSAGGPAAMPGTWDPAPAAAFLLVGLVLGGAFYLSTTVRNARVVDPFVGGEVLNDQPSMRVSGVAFYETIERRVGFGPIYRLAQQHWFDMYDVGVRLAAAAVRPLSGMHNGALLRYLAWSLLGCLVLGYALLRGRLW